MKKLTAILAASVAGASFASAEDLSISSTFGWESDYVFRGVQLADDYFAPSVDLSYGGLYTGVWAALPVDHVFDNEVDVYGGYGMSLNEMVSLDFGFTYYTYPNSEDDFFDSDVNTFETYAGASFEVPLSPSIYVFHDWDLDAWTFEGSLGHSFEVSDVAAVDVGAFLGHVDASGADEYYYYGVSAGYNYSFTPNASVNLGINWYGSEDHTMDPSYSNGVFTGYDDDYALTYSISFTAGF